MNERARCLRYKETRDFPARPHWLRTGDKDQILIKLCLRCRGDSSISNMLTSCKREDLSVRAWWTNTLVKS